MDESESRLRARCRHCVEWALRIRTGRLATIGHLGRRLFVERRLIASNASLHTSEALSTRYQAWEICHQRLCVVAYATSSARVVSIHRRRRYQDARSFRGANPPKCEYRLAPAHADAEQTVTQGQ